LINKKVAYKPQTAYPKIGKNVNVCTGLMVAYGL